METVNIPHQSGIYQIRCISNSKIYIGSAIDMRGRCDHHRTSLRRRDHRNPHLQAAWDKYGEENFECGVLALTHKSDLLRLEQEWIDATNCTDPEIGFNIYDIAGSPGDANAQKWEGFIDPKGNEIIITNLFAFCREHGLDFPSMHRLAMGKSKLKSYKGWTHRNSVRQRDYVKTYDGFIDPEGNLVEPITNLAAFCHDRGLDDTHMVAVAHGRLYSHQGWIYNNARENRGVKTHIGFINPNGEKVVIVNLQEFCRQNDLQPMHMYELINGKRKSHKGWTWKDNNE